MKKRSEKEASIVKKLIGFGDTSTRKSYYPELNARIKELQGEREKYKNIFDNALCGIFQLDKEGVIIDGNPAMAEIFGYASPKELIQAGISLFSEDLTWDQLKSQGAVTLHEARFSKNTGEMIWVSMNLKMTTQNNHAHLEGFLQDITDIKAASEEVLKLKNYLHNVVNSMPSLLIGMDTNCRITHMNIEAESFGQAPFAGAEGKQIDEIFSFLSPQMPKIREAFEEKSIQKIPRASSDARLYDITVYPLVTNGVEGAVIRADDVTERIRMEEMMIQAEKMLSVGGLAAGMAHEINNPLAGIIQNIQVLERRLNLNDPSNNAVAQELGIDTEKFAEYMDKRQVFRIMSSIRESGKRASNVVDSMLSFSRKSAVAMEMCDLTKLLDKTLELASKDYDLKKKYDFRKINIKRQYDPKTPKVFCDSGKIQQVFLNILHNGAQAMIKEMVPDKAPQFTLIVNPEKDHVTIEIKDNGPGMTEEVKKRVFEPFFTTKAVGVGTGLGLSVSYFIITENHKGAMDVKSAPNQGASFIIKLPVSPKELD